MVSLTGAAKMKDTARSLKPRESSLVANEHACMEILSFLQALNSYPEHFAREPEISFEQHRISLDKEESTQVG
ncbi:MAG TPA: hypothetical protein VKR60_02270 [Candidatus Sulfotelmatobacter sp.]|nr:hypothetical protein [Candidatus Sulfotelmatobacter sp.]